MIDSATLNLLDAAERLLGTAQTHIEPSSSTVSVWLQISNLRKQIREQVPAISALRQLEAIVPDDGEAKEQS